MRKTIRDNRGYPIGWTETSDKKGTYNEFIDGANYTHSGYVAETMQSLCVDERSEVQEKGELW